MTDCISKNTGNVKNLKNEDIFCAKKVSCHAMSAPEGVFPGGKVILDYINSLPSITDMEVAKVRAMRKSQGNPFEHPCSRSVTKIDLTIPSSGVKLPARMYRPALTEGQFLPCLVYFHGGGFVLDNIESHDRMLSKITEISRVMVISVEYRLAPETVFPGAVNDAVNSFSWLHKNAENLLIDASRMAIGGDSAGANLAAVACMILRDNCMPMPKFQLLIYPCTIGNDSSESREQFSEGLLLTKKSIKWFHDHYINKEHENDPRFHILSANNHSDLPCAFVLTSGFDPLRDEGEAYARKLRDSGVRVKHSCYTDMFHGFINYGTLKQAQDAVEECSRELIGSLLTTFYDDSYT